VFIRGNFASGNNRVRLHPPNFLQVVLLRTYAAFFHSSSLNTCSSESDGIRKRSLIPEVKSSMTRRKLSPAAASNCRISLIAHHETSPGIRIPISEPEHTAIAGQLAICVFWDARSSVVHPCQRDLLQNFFPHHAREFQSGAGHGEIKGPFRSALMRNEMGLSFMRMSY
jgi:hypothetical protein